MSDASPPINGVRVIIAVLGALVIFSVLSQVLEASLVRATGGDEVTSMASYLAVLSRPSLLAAKIAVNVVVGLLTGYIAGKIAGTREVTFAGIAAAAESCSLAWGYMTGEYAVLPLWFRILSLVVTGPAMLTGAWIRMQARMAMEAAPAPSATGTAAGGGPS
jgi:hypothetical protein